jgi:hypothetical protein
MTGLAEWLVAHRTARVTLIAALFPLPLLSAISAALIVLTTSARGWRLATQDVAAAALLLMAVTAAMGGLWFQVGIAALATWLVLAMLAELRRSASLTLAVQCAVLLGVVGTLAFTAWSEDPQAYWEELLRDWAVRARAAGLEIAQAAAQVMTGMMAASAVASALVSLFIGCWAAGQLNGRSFGREFQDIRMGRVLGLLAGVIALLFLTGARSIADDLLLVMALGFLVQGLAVVHWHAARRDWPKAWPAALYLPLALPPTAGIEMTLLALLGLVDNGYSLRRLDGKVV